MESATAESNDSFLGRCICDGSGKVVEQNKFIEQLCGKKVGEICASGCRKFLRLEEQYEVSLLKYRSMYGKCFHITGHKNKNQEMIILNPVVSQQAYFNLDSLSPKEREVAELMLNGLLNSEIVRKLQITKATLKTHINHIYQKIGTEFKIQRLQLLS